MVGLGVVAGAVIDAAKEGKPVGDLRRLRQQSAEHHAGNPGADHAERPSVLGHRVGLGVPGFHVPRPAIEPQQNRAFEIQVTGGGSARQNATPEGKRRYALIADAPAVEKGDDTEYPVVVYAGNAGHKVLMRGMKPLCAKDVQSFYMAHYDMDHSTEQSRHLFLEKVRARAARI